MKLADLQQSDASIYCFTYSFRNATGYHMTCHGVASVRLHILPLLLASWRRSLLGDSMCVLEGQRMRLTCVLTCAVSLNSNPGYIWYKNRLQLHGSRTNSCFLSLDPISYEDSLRLDWLQRLLLACCQPESREDPETLCQMQSLMVDQKSTVYLLWL